jgi:hypothetical protein
MNWNWEVVQHEEELPDHCGFWAHAVNLFKMRERDTEKYVEDTRWHWIFQNMTTDNADHI